MIADALLIAGSGLLGSSHCVGMCGPIVLSIGAAEPSPRSNFVRQLLHACGRIFTYSFLGALAGAAGSAASADAPTLARAQAWLAMLAGVVLVAVGLSSAGIVRLEGLWPAGGCAAGRLFAPLLRLPGRLGAFLAGLFNGFLPCGLVYAFLTLAATTASPWRGMAVMACFGAGTVPALALVGCGGMALSPSFRRKVLRAAACLVIVTGLFATVRGAQALAAPTSAPPPCPFCSAASLEG